MTELIVGRKYKQSTGNSPRTFECVYVQHIDGMIPQGVFRNIENSALSVFSHINLTLLPETVEYYGMLHLIKNAEGDKPTALTTNWYSDKRSYHTHKAIFDKESGKCLEVVKL